MYIHMYYVQYVHGMETVIFEVAVSSRVYMLRGIRLHLLGHTSMVAGLIWGPNEMNCHVRDVKEILCHDSVPPVPACSVQGGPIQPTTYRGASLSVRRVRRRRRGGG